MLTQDRLKELLNYDEATGVFSWAKPSSARIKPGAVCNCVARSGHIVIRLDGVLYLAQRLAWLWGHGRMPGMVRHSNGDRTDNRISNLVEIRDETPTKSKPRSRSRAFITREEWLSRFAQKHGDRYTYIESDIRGADKKITILCARHGPFSQTPTMHANGNGCPKCANEETGERNSTGTAALIEAFRQAHGERYDYSLVKSTRVSQKAEIVCRKHGAFKQLAADHMQGRGCRQCYAETIGERDRKPHDALIAQFIEVHGERYDYSLVEYKGNKQRIKIVCPDHGEFEQIASDHLNGSVCPKCVNMRDPKANREIYDFILSLGVEPVREYQPFDDRRAIDVYVPSCRVGIEHNGLVWHSEKFHPKPRTHLIKKHRDANAAGIRLINIMSDEWMFRREACESMIRHALGKSENVHGRQCQFSLLDGTDQRAKALLDQHHIQGAANCSFYGALEHGGELVMVAAFRVLRSHRTNTDATRWELARMASSVHVRGGASKIMRNVLKRRPDIHHVTTYYDHRLFNGGTVYEHMGFTKTKEYGPDYHYVVGMHRKHKSLFQKARIAKQFGVDMSGKTERDAMIELGYFRVWDCGRSRYELIVK